MPIKPAAFVGPASPCRVGRCDLPSLLVAALALSACAGDWPPAPALRVVAEEEPGLLPSSVRAQADGREAGRWLCTFSYRSAGEARSVALAGTFNGWRRDAQPMRDAGGDGVWACEVSLDAGVHQYKFVVDGQRWLRDPRNPEGMDDNHGGQNSVLRLGQLARLTTSPAKRGDGRIDAIGLEHRPERPLFVQALSPRKALLRVRTFSHDVESVAAVTRAGATVAMTPVEEGPLFTLWEAVVSFAGADEAETSSRQAEYTFVLRDADLRASDVRTYTFAADEANIFDTPDWAKHAVWYQIMLDRFRNGDPRNDPNPVVPWTMDWFSAAPFEGRDGQSFYKYYVFLRYYGGDLAGLEERLPYLKELGVNAIYLNPIFEAEAHHKYHTTSFVHVDDQFGTKGDYARAAAREDLLDPSTWTWTETDQAFLRFLKKAHAMGFRVIIDGVFSHVGRTHPAFQDVLKNGRDSRYADWFDVTSWEPFEYVGWAGVRDLPIFKKSADGLASEEVKQHVYAVTRRWMDPNGDGDPSDGIDGWRLDVPNEIPAPFWVGWRKLVKSINPDAYITGEIWDRADLWLDGEHFDAVMNYEFARAAMAWVFNKTKKIKVSEIDRRLRELRLAYPLAATQVMQNLMDSHDTDRIASMAHNPDRGYDQQNRVQDNGPNYDGSKPSDEAYARARLVLLLQMTYVGSPMIYYGDEVGMWGADDPTCRKPMLWEDLQPYEKPDENFVAKDHLAVYRRAIALRNLHPALRTGSFRTLLADDAADAWVFLRTNGNEQLIVALNASAVAAEVSFPLPDDSPTQWSPVFGEGTIESACTKLKLRIPPISGMVLLAKKSGRRPD